MYSRTCKSVLLVCFYFHLQNQTNMSVSGVPKLLQMHVTIFIKMFLIFSHHIVVFFVSVFLQDPEALAQLMKSMPLTNDGKFLLLESETGEAPNGGGQEDLESEA